MDEGYQNEIKQACIANHRPFHSEKHEQAKTKEVVAWDDAELRKYLVNNKTSMATPWAKAILGAEGDRSIPRAIRDLLRLVDRALASNGSPTTP